MLKLARRFSPIMLLTIGLNGMIGSAWLFAPLYAAKIAGSACLIAWLIGGLATALVALTFTELAVMFPLAGGSAQIPQLSHGTLTSFVGSWTAWLSALTMAPIEVQAILQYASTFFPSLVHNVHGAPVLTALGLMWATGLMLSFCIINIVSFKGLERFNLGLFLFKIIVIVLTIFAFIETQFSFGNFADLFPTMASISGWHAILTALASGGIAFAFTGFKHGVELAGEAKQSSYSIPLSIVGSVLLCLVIYLGLQVAFLGVLDESQLRHGFRYLSYTGDAGPFAGLAAMLGLVFIMKLLYLDAAVSPAGAGLVYVTSTARILYAMSQIGTMPKWLSYVNKQHFPIAAIFCNFVLGMLLFLPLPGWQAMVSFLVSGMVVSYAIGPIALYTMRLEYPNKQRKFRLYGVPLLSFSAFYFCNLLSFWTGWDTIFKLSIALVIGFFFFIFAYLNDRLKSKSLGLQSAFWLIPYLCGLVTISYLGSFGGGRNIIPFGYDFIVIFLFSMVIFYLAVKYRLRHK